MRVKKYLAISSTGRTRITKGRPALATDEVAILLEIDIPNEVFKRPQFGVSIKVPDIGDREPPQVDEVALIEKIEEVTGYNVNLTVCYERDDDR